MEVETVVFVQPWFVLCLTFVFVDCFCRPCYREPREVCASQREGTWIQWWGIQTLGSSRPWTRRPTLLRRTSLLRLDGGREWNCLTWSYVPYHLFQRRLWYWACSMAFFFISGKPDHFLYKADMLMPILWSSVLATMRANVFVGPRWDINVAWDG